MIGACEIPGCGEIIVSQDILPQPGHDLEALALQNFDRFASLMLQHITSGRHPEHARESLAVMHLAAKVYGMTWARSSTPNFSVLRKSWRTAIVTELGKDPDQAAVAADSPAASDNSSPEPPLGSKEKKSERKVST